MSNLGFGTGWVELQSLRVRTWVPNTEQERTLPPPIIGAQTWDIALAGSCLGCWALSLAQARDTLPHYVLHATGINWTLLGIIYILNWSEANEGLLYLTFVVFSNWGRKLMCICLRELFACLWNGACIWPWLVLGGKLKQTQLDVMWIFLCHLIFWY